MTVFLNGKEMCSRQALHDHLKQQLNLPDYYGRNLDALYDCLTERSEPTELLLADFACCREALGKYADALLSTLYHAALHNPQLQIRELPTEAILP